MSNWDNVTVAQYIEIKELDSQDLTPLELFLEKISIITDNDYFDLYEDELNDILTEYDWINTLPPVNTKSNFKTLTFGNFIDLENYCTEKPPIENIDKICATIKGYEILTFECEKIREEPITKHYSTVQSFVEYRAEILEKYKGLLEDDDPEPDEEEPEEIQPTKPEQTNTKWGWQRLIYGLCNGDVTKVKDVTSLGHILVLNWLSMESELKLKG